MRGKLTWAVLAIVVGIVCVSGGSVAVADNPEGFWLLTSWEADFPVQRFDLNGAYSGEHIQTDAMGLGVSRAACLGPDDVFYLIQAPAGSSDATIQAYDAWTGQWIRQLSGPGSGGYSYPNFFTAAPYPCHGMKAGPAGDALYLVHSGRIHKYDLQTGKYTPWDENIFYYSAPAWYDPTGVYSGWPSNTAWDLVFPSKDEMLVLLRKNSSVLHYALPDPFATKELVTSGSGGLDTPRGLAIGPDGNLYISSLNTDSVLRFDLQTGAFIDVFVPTGAGGLDDPGRVVFGPDGNLYVVSQATGSVLRYDGSSGDFLDVFISGPMVSAPYELVYVPEPATLGLLAIAALTLRRRRRG